MENTQRTIVTFFRRNAPWNVPEMREDEYLLGVQAIPLRLIIEPPICPGDWLYEINSGGYRGKGCPALSRDQSSHEMSSKMGLAADINACNAFSEELRVPPGPQSDKIVP
jgi:hypothetical protein